MRVALFMRNRLKEILKIKTYIEAGKVLLQFSVNWFFPCTRKITFSPSYLLYL